MNLNILNFSQNSRELYVTFMPSELNLFNIDEISQTYMDYLKNTDKKFDTVYFVLNNIKTIDSSSVAFLVRAHLNAKKNKTRLVLKDIPKNLQKTLDFANLLKDFEVQ
ncbi:MAG: STAS domain-containing protein [Spirochaetota bacterium]